MSRLRLHAALFSVSALFAANYIISKIGMREISPLAFAWLRVAGSAIILAMVELRDTQPRLSRDDGRRVLRYSVLGVVLNQSLFLGGLSLTTVHVAAILITTIPVFTLGAAIVTGREAASAARIGGIAVACAGAVLVVGGEGFQGGWRSMAGAAMIVANCLSYALYLVLSKPDMTRLSARRVVARMFAAAAVLLLPVCGWSLWHQRWASVSPAAWLAVAAVIAGPTVGAYLINAWTLRHADSSVVAAYTYFQPVLATILGALIFGETIGPVVLIAAALIFGGVAIASRATAAKA